MRHIAYNNDPDARRFVFFPTARLCLKVENLPLILSISLDGKFSSFSYFFFVHFREAEKKCIKIILFNIKPSAYCFSISWHLFATAFFHFLSLAMKKKCHKTFARHWTLNFSTCILKALWNVVSSCIFFLLCQTLERYKRWIKNLSCSKASQLFSAI